MIKGKYVATIRIDFNLDDSKEGVLPLEKISEKIIGGELDDSICELLSDELFISDEDGKVTIENRVVEVWKEM